MDLIEPVGLGPGHAGVQHQGLAPSGLGQLLGVIHELHTVALAPLVLVGDDAGDIAGGTGHPEGVEISAMAEAVVLVAVHQEEGKAVLVGQNFLIDLAGHVLVVGVVGPQLDDIVKGCFEVFHRRVLKFHGGPSFPVSDASIINLCPSPCQICAAILPAFFRFFSKFLDTLPVTPTKPEKWSDDRSLTCFQKVGIITIF